MIIEPGLIVSQKNRLGSEGGSVSSAQLNFLLDIYLGALSITEVFSFMNITYIIHCFNPLP